MNGKIPQGKGMFLWLLNRLEKHYGSMRGLAASLAAEGYDWVCVETNQGTWTGGSYPDDKKEYRQQELIAELIPELEKYRIEFHAWCYIMGDYFTKGHTDAEAEITLEQIRKWQPLSMTVNAEHHHKAKGSEFWAKRFMDLLIEGMVMDGDIPNIPLGLSSYKFPLSHPEFPWRSFLERCDFAAPQVYWQKDDRPLAGRLQLDKAIGQWLAIADIPLVPAGTLYPEGEWWPSEAQVLAFTEACEEHPLVPGVNYWEYEYLKYKPANRKALSDYDWQKFGAEPGPGPGDEPGEGEDMSEIMGKLDEILGIVKDLEKNLASHHLDVMGKLEWSSTDDDPGQPPQYEPDVIEVTVQRDGNPVYLSYFTETNNQGRPIFKFYPSDGSKVAERVFVRSGARLKVYPKLVLGDGGNHAYKLDMSQVIPLMANSAPLPGGVHVQLYVMEKFVV